MTVICGALAMRYMIIAAAFLTTATAVASVHAEVPLLPRVEQQRLAQHIVTGQVRHVYTTEKASHKNHVDTLFAVEVIVNAVEKGEAIKPRQVIFVRTWRMKKRERGWAGPSGQATIPKPGQNVKLYLTGGNGSHNALSPNGIEIVK